ncbi:GNAT family acetyltransferase [Thalassobaculum sp.]|uniref:GNAT family acetyltransferase n=1 Tax=Thalassobaculum sp. TaxID=2022740 RepID=UPI003B5CA2A9
MSLTFRPVANGDIDGVVDLWERCGLLVPHNDPRRDIESARRAPDADVLVADVLGKIVASCMVGYDGHRGWVYYVAVDPGRRRASMGRQVMEAAEAWMKARGVPKAELLIRDTNVQVRDFYAKLGWNEEPRVVMSKTMAGAPAIGLGTVETVVTSLEMLNRPTRPSPHPPSSVRTALIRAEPPTVSFYRYLYNSVGGDWTWVSRRLMDDAELAGHITDPKVEVYVLYVDGAPAGYGEIDRRSDDGNVELAYFGLLPEFIGRGVGRYLLDTMVDIAWTGPTTRLWVHTCDLDHPRAIGTYQKAGFVPFDQYVETLPDPRLAGLPLPQRRPSPSDTVTALGDDTVTPIRR